MLSVFLLVFVASRLAGRVGWLGSWSMISELRLSQSSCSNANETDGSGCGTKGEWHTPQLGHLRDGRKRRLILRLNRLNNEVILDVSVTMCCNALDEIGQVAVDVGEYVYRFDCLVYFV